MDQASLLAAFTLPVANAAPASPVFANLISLMLSTPNQAALTPPAVAPSNSKTPVQGMATTPAQTADAMIRSMLGRPSSGTAASAASENLSSTPAALPNKNTASADEQAVPVAIPTLSDPLIVPKTADAVVAVSAPHPVQIPLPPAQAPRNQPRNSTDAMMTNVIPVVTMPALPTAVTPPPADPKSPAPAMPRPAATQDSTASVVTLPLAKNSAEAKVAFTAILTPTKETPEPSASAASPAMPTPEPAGGGNSRIPVPQPSVQLAAAANPQPQGTASPVMAGQVSTAQAGGDAQPDGDASAQQESDSPETPARPTAIASAAKIKPEAQPDDNALQAAATPVVAHPVAVPSFTASPIDPARVSAPMQSNATAPVATPYNATGEALRTTESNLAAAPPLRTGAAQEISIRIAPPDSPAVDLRVVERAGQVHVDVRTPDSAMQTSLRQDLGTLTNSLERAGYHTETFTPSSTPGRAAASAQTDNHQQDPSQNRGGADNFSGGRRQQQQKRSGPWLEELEEQS